MENKYKLKIYRDPSKITFGYEILNSKNEVELMSDGFESEELVKQEVRYFRDVFNQIENLD